MLKLTLADGEVVIGTPNYVTEHGAQIRTQSGALVDVDRSKVEKIEKVTR